MKSWLTAEGPFYCLCLLEVHPRAHSTGIPRVQQDYCSVHQEQKGSVDDDTGPIAFQLIRRVEIGVVDYDPPIR